MDSSTPTTPISHQSNPRLLRSKLEDPPESFTPPSSTRRSIHSPNPVSLQDLLLSPPPYRKSRPRPRPLVVDECICSAAAAVAVTPVSRKKSKSSSRAAGASPRNARRARRRLEKEIVREERELVLPFEEDGGRVRKRRQSRAKSSRGERLALVASAPPSSPSPRVCDEEIEGAESEERSGGSHWELFLELVMWKNAPKSSLWFGLGTMFFLSSCFSKNVSFSLISAVSHLGLLVLGLAFFYDSFPQRQQQKQRRESFKLTEEDIIRVARLILPMANAALAKSQEVFSGEPLMTLKVAPVLVFTAKYGHMITPWRLLATGFFLSFTLPKLCYCYSDNIQKKVEEMSSYVWEAWKSCPHKRFVTASITMLLWNVFSVKMRLFAAFISAALLRYHHHQQRIGGEGVETESREGELLQPIVVAEYGLQTYTGAAQPVFVAAENLLNYQLSSLIRITTCTVSF